MTTRVVRRTRRGAGTLMQYINRVLVLILRLLGQENCDDLELVKIIILILVLVLVLVVQIAALGGDVGVFEDVGSGGGGGNVDNRGGNIACFGVDGKRATATPEGVGWCSCVLQCE